MTIMRMSSQLGTTIGEYNALLAANAVYLQEIGEPTHDVRRLLALELRKAAGAITGLPLDQVKDAGSDADLPLTFERTYRQPIFSRHRLGVLGRGLDA